VRRADRLAPSWSPSVGKCCNRLLSQEQTQGEFASQAGRRRFDAAEERRRPRSGIRSPASCFAEATQDQPTPRVVTIVTRRHEVSFLRRSKTLHQSPRMAIREPGGGAQGGIASGGGGGPEGGVNVSASISTTLGLSISQSVTEATPWQCAAKDCRRATAILRVPRLIVPAVARNNSWTAAQKYDMGQLRK